MTNLLTPSAAFRPYRYPWAIDAWRTQNQIHWLPEEVPMAPDVKDWNNRLTQAERNLVTQILRFFAQSDTDVNSNYMNYFLRVFKPNEIQMMMTAFSNSESCHQVAYAHLLDTLGLEESEFTVFLQYKAMKDKHDYMSEFRGDDPRSIAKTMATFGAFTEGMALFASFAMLLNFQRFGKLVSMNQIVAWSVRDETLHCLSMIKLFHTFCEENPGLLDDSLRQEIADICQEMVRHEDAFIDLAFELGPVEGMSADEIKQYIRFIADRRLIQLGLPCIYNVRTNPLPWLDEVLNSVEHVNFFENRATEYSRAATQGTWEDAF